MRNMEKNLKIRMRLLIVFLITILIALALTFLSIRQTIKIQKDYTSILTGPIAITNAVQSSETEVNSIARQLRDMALSGYDTSIMDEIQASVDSIEKSISTIQTLYTDSDGVAQTYIQSVREWENAFEDIHTALQADNLEEARRLIETQCTPKLNQAVSDGNTLIREVQNDLDAHIDSTQASVSRSQIVLFIMAILVVAIGILLNLRAIRNITRPLQEAEQAVVAFSQGDLSVELTYEASNEIGTICDAVRTSQDILGRVIEDIVQITKGLADGDLTVESHEEYPGQLMPVKTNIEYLLQNLNATMSEILNASDQVSAGAEQVSVGSQSLAQGATEQASAVQELSATINEIDTSAQNSAETAKTAKEKSDLAAGQVQVCNDRMQELSQAMDDIYSGQKDIGADHRHHRKHCLPDQYPGAERGGRGRTRGQCRQGLRGGCRRGAQSCLQIGPGSQAVQGHYRNLPVPCGARQVPGGGGKLQHAANRCLRLRGDFLHGKGCRQRNFGVSVH